MDRWQEEKANFKEDRGRITLQDMKNSLVRTPYIEYPYMSIHANQSGVSVVEFILYPNGTISDLKVIKSSNYFLLDDNTMETIEAAYSDYPRPPKPTVIKIYVKYILN